MAGCANNGDETRAAFKILVTHNDKPLAGVTFHISAKGVEQIAATSDDTGTVHVEGLSPGEYWLSGDFLGTGVIYTCFHVKRRPSRNAKANLKYEWGDDAPATRRIAGRLVDSQTGKGGTPIWNLSHRIDVAIAGVGLTLRDPVSHAIYSTASDKDGRFSFEGLPNGTYVLHLEGGSAGNDTFGPTDSVLELDNTARRSELLFKGGPSGCGSGNELMLDVFD